MSWLFSTLRFLKEMPRVVEMLSRIGRHVDTDRSLPEHRRGVVLFNTVRTYVSIQLVIEIMLALKLKAIGFDVHLLYDDEQLYHHETLTKNDLSPFQTCYRMRRFFSLRLLQRLPLVRGMLTPYSRYVSRADLQVLNDPRVGELSTYCGIELEPFVRASLVRFYLSAPDLPLLESEPDYMKARTMFVRNAIVSITAAERVLAELKPVMVVTSHGIYSSWGTFMKFMLKHGVRTITYGLNGYGPTNIDLAADTIAANKSDGGYLKYLAETVVDQTLSRIEVAERVGHLMDERYNHSSADIARLGAAETASQSPVLQRLDQHRSHGREIFALFPNVMWDNATTFEETNRVFDSPVEWLVETVRFFAREPQKVLVIRVHPAERSFMAVRKSVRDILIFHLGEQILQQENIIVVAPEEPLSSYSLFDYMKAGIVYNGTIGLELVFRHIALIIGARAAYSDAGFTHDIQDRQQYFAAFDDTARILKHQDKNLDAALLFAYEYFFLHGVPMKFMSPKQVGTPNYECPPDEIWSDHNLEHVVRVMAGEREYFQDYWRQNEKSEL